MALPKGYAGKVLTVDLTKLEAKATPTDRFCRDYDIDLRLWLGDEWGFASSMLKFIEHMAKVDVS
jgi:hypothetical protein